jgi:hypothetical protein
LAETASYIKHRKKKTDLMACSIHGAGGGGKRAYRGGSAQLHLQAASAAPRLPVAVHIMLRYEQVSNSWDKTFKIAG